MPQFPLFVFLPFAFGTTHPILISVFLLSFRRHPVRPSKDAQRLTQTWPPTPFLFFLFFFFVTKYFFFIYFSIYLLNSFFLRVILSFVFLLFSIRYPPPPPSIVSILKKKNIYAIALPIFKWFTNLNFKSIPAGSMKTNNILINRWQKKK